MCVRDDPIPKDVEGEGGGVKGQEGPTCSFGFHWSTTTDAVGFDVDTSTKRVWKGTGGGGVELGGWLPLRFAVGAVGESRRGEL